MKNKSLLVIISCIILSILFTSLVSAEEPLYGRNGVLVYKDHIIKKVCYPFMPCGITRIDIPSYNDHKNTYHNNQLQRTSTTSTNSPPGFFRIFSPTYDPTTDTDKNQNYNRIIVRSAQTYRYGNQYSNQHNYQPTPIKHFPNTYNTRNNYDSNGNWIGSS